MSNWIGQIIVILIVVFLKQYPSWGAEWLINKNYTNFNAKTDKIYAYYPREIAYKQIQTLCARFVLEDKVSGIKSTKNMLITFYTDVVELDYDQSQKCISFGEKKFLIIDGVVLGMQLFSDEVFQYIKYYTK